MASESVIQGARSILRHPRTVLGRPRGPMVQTNFFRKRSCPPTLHSRGEKRDMIHVSTLQCKISVDLFKALAMIQSACPRHVFDVDESTVVSRVSLPLGSINHIQFSLYG